MIKVKLKTETIMLKKICSLADILIAHGYTSTHFSVAINRNFIPRSQHHLTLLKNDDVIDIISPMQGG